VTVPTTIDIGTIAAILAALAALLLTVSLVLLRAERAFSRRLRTFITAYLGDTDVDDRLAAVREQPNLLVRLNRLLARGQLTAGIRRDLTRAGSPLQASQFIYLRFIAAGLGAGLFFLIGGQIGEVAQSLATLLGLIGGWMVPMFIIRTMQRRRLAAFERHLPDATDIMAGSLEAGSSLPMALELVAREMPPPVSTEFARALREVSLGMALEDALLNMLDRVYSEDLDMLATAVAIQFRVGGNLAEVLKVIAHTIRERVRIRNDIRTMTAQQTMSANILILMPIFLGVLMFIINPAYERRLFDPGFPQIATASAALMVVLAFFILRRIVSIDA
jgi:tight adherence protein B